MIGLLESRLDVVIYRAKFAPTIFSARQIVNHGHVLVDGKYCNIASCRLKPGQVVEIKEGSRNMTIILGAVQSNNRPTPEYLEVDGEKLSAKYNRIPILNDVPYPITMEPSLVVEFYSR
jgi:small subunit ribosomal protein S4